MSRDRLLDLMTARATEGIDAAELRELDPMLAAQDEFGEDDLELAAAAADLALQRHAAPSGESMPADLRARVLAQSAELVGAGKAESRSDVLPFPGKSADPPAAKSTKGFNATAWLGWAVAAVLALVFVPWPIGTPDKTVETPTVAVVAPTSAEEREALLGQGGDVIQVAWATPTEAGYEQVTGDVVWSDREQRGYMRLRGLPAITDGDDQYQLWIVDPEVDKHPVDGGVFDMPAGIDEAIIPIDSKLAVDNPAVFAITREKRGGVVVSAGPLLVIAAVEA